MNLFRKKIQPKTVTINTDYSDNVSIDFNSIPKNEDELQNVLNIMMQSIRESDKRFNDIDRGMDEITGVDYRPVTIQDWLYAMRTADQPWEGGYRSNWVKLFDVYFNMLQDSHVQACVETIVNSVQSKDFYIADEFGKRDDETTILFKSRWFYDYQEAVINSDLWGFGLIQLQDFDGENINIREINRKHVRPDLRGIVKQQYDNSAYRSWDNEPFKTWTIYLFNNRLGKLNPAVRWFIYKTEIARFWAKFNQLYGVPPVVAKTKLIDTVRKKNMVDMVKKWLTSRWMVMDMEDDIVNFGSNSTGGSGQAYFENLIRLADEQISKTLLGSTMILDNGSSRSQSEVHEDNTDKFSASYLRMIKFSADKDLIPRLRKIGFKIPDKRFIIWDNSEKLTMKERAEVINLVNLNYKVDESVASEFIGIELEEKEEVEVIKTPLEPTREELENIYKTRMNASN